MESYLTRRLLDEQTDPNLHPVLIKTLCALASDADTERITDFLCAHPESNLAFDVLLRHGCQKQVQRLWKVWKRSGVPEGGFSLLGRFAVQEVAPAAWEAVCSGDWFAARDAVMGLLGLDLSELRREILARLDFEEGRSLFTEMLPALAVRAGWPNVLPRLRCWCDQASTDCLGGLILGLALVGAKPKSCSKQCSTRSVMNSTIRGQGISTGLGWRVGSSIWTFFGCPTNFVADLPQQHCSVYSWVGCVAG